MENRSIVSIADYGKEKIQYLLDMGKPEVEAFALNMLRDLMSRYRIDYFKWDMNRPLTDASEEIAPMAREKQVLAVYRILEKLFPCPLTFPEWI